MLEMLLVQLVSCSKMDMSVLLGYCLIMDQGALVIPPSLSRVLGGMNRTFFGSISAGLFSLLLRQDSLWRNLYTTITMAPIRGRPKVGGVAANLNGFDRVKLMLLLSMFM